MKVAPKMRDYSKLFPPDRRGGKPNPTLSPLEKLGWQSFFAQQTSVDQIEITPPVRVMEVHRNALHVVGVDDLDITIPSLHDAAVGDWVLLDHAQPQTSIILERKSLIKRRAAGSERQVQLIAANIDTAFIVSSCNQDFNIARLERYVALAFEAEITPVIILTKADLASDIEKFVEEAHTISELVDVVTLDARGDEPKDKLADWCKPGKTVAFLGSSGVGKSTLTNALAGSQSIETQATRESDAKGRHTTTRRQLHIMPDGCMVVDTPGMRELQLTDAASGIGDVFADIQSLSTECKFKDCQHKTEPGCAVQSARERGDIDEARLTRWRKLVAEEMFNTSSLAQRKTKDRTIGKMIKHVKKNKRKIGKTYE